MTGNVKKLMGDKSFGFIWGENGTQYFFHRNDYLGHWQDLCDDFQRGATIKVEFQPLDRHPKGPRAENVGRENFPDAARLSTR